MSELFSVVIPTYNYGRFVTEAVASALAQTHPAVEVIVIDDGSTDDTRQRLAPFMDRIRYIFQANQGLSAARNTGIREARGDWIALLDSDDVWHPRKLELQARCLADHPDVALLGTGQAAAIESGWPAVDVAGDLPMRRVSLRDLVLAAPFGPSSVVIRKKCFDRAGLFDPGLRSAEDRDMWVRIAAHYPAAHLPLPLFWYRLHGSNMSAVAVTMEANEFKVLRRAFAEQPALRRRWLFRLLTFSRAYFDAAKRYRAARHWFTALGRFVQSFCLWPLPYPRKIVDCPLARPKMLAVLLLRMLHLRPPEPLPRAALGAPTPACDTTT
jgi:glycosyltransferase involved in cell wall biosynthesis